MQTTKSILCLWVGCSLLAGFGAYSLGMHDFWLSVLDDLRQTDPEGQNWPLIIPIYLALVVACLGAVLALGGLLCSWRLNKQPLLSRPHLCALLFLLPLLSTMLSR